MGQPFGSLIYGLASGFSSSLLIPIPYLLLRSLPCNNVGLYRTPFFLTPFL